MYTKQGCCSCTSILHWSPVRNTVSCASGSGAVVAVVPARELNAHTKQMVSAVCGTARREERSSTRRLHIEQTEKYANHRPCRITILASPLSLALQTCVRVLSIPTLARL